VQAVGGVRQFLTPYGVEIVELPELQRSSSSTSAVHTPIARSTWTAVRIRDSHAAFYGHSIGWWEGDTLNVETPGFNEGFWIDRRGLPTTEKLRTLEKFTRTTR
jgi:hypothetical protein